MSTRETKETKCDECGKVFQASRKSGTWEHLDPFDPWLHVSVSGGWVTSYGKAIKSDRDACSPECAIKMLKNVIERIEKAKALEDRVG